MCLTLFIQKNLDASGGRVASGVGETAIGSRKKRRSVMLHYALVFLVIAILAAIFGFGMAATAFTAITKVLFFLFLVGFVVSLVMHMTRRV